jgi:photosystem II stability/assembly factor-like uncharacterized protein
MKPMRRSVFVCMLLLIGTLPMTINVILARGPSPQINVSPKSSDEPLQRHQVTPWTPTKPVPPSQIPTAPTVLLSSTVWTAIGPAPLNSNSANGNVSGRITGIAAHPTDPLTIYVSPAGGGVWNTINGGATWTPLTDTQSTLSMGAIAVAASNPNVIYAGTGEANNSLDSNFGRGILTSLDGGATWTLRTGPAGVFNTQRVTVSAIAVNPTDPMTAYAAIADFGNNGVCCTSGTTGIYKTGDGGVTWTNVTSAFGLDSTRPWSDVQIDPTTPTTLYGAHGEHDGDAANGVYKSIDSGATWTLLTNAPNGTSSGRIAIAISKSNHLVVYVTSNDPITFALFRIERSDNGGATFTDLTAGTPNYMGGQGWYDTTAIVDPANSAIVYVGGAAGANSILRSTNSGVTWTDISSGAVAPHVDHHAIGFDSNGKLLDGDDGGIYRLDNPTAPTWTNLNGNLQTIQFQGIGLHPTNANIAIGGSQDNGTEVYSGTLLWSETDGGDGGFAKFSQTNGNRAYHQIPNLSFGTNFFRRSDNTGATWVTKTSSISVDVNNQNFYAPFVVDPGNGDRVLYGTNRVWESLNGGDVWIAISTVANLGNNNVDSIGLSASDMNTIYASGAGNLYVTTNHGATWTQHNLPIGGTVQDIQVDPTTSTTAYAVINRFTGGGNVFKTTNGGVLWTNISGNLPSEPVWSLQIDPSVASTFYVGAEDGVYFTTNGGTTWSRFGTGLPNAQVYEIELNNGLRILGAGIHGRGMWEISTGCTLTCPPNQFANTGPGATQCCAVVNYPAPTTTGTCGTVSCTPPAGTCFPVGTTTVTCTTTAGPSCSFLVVIVDNTPPTITCPQDIIAVGNPGDFCVPVNFTVTASDNCPGVTVKCVNNANPSQMIMSGFCFPTVPHCTTVKCTATDASANTAVCTFNVCVFDVCMEDDADPSKVLLFDSFTGDYIFCCGSFSLSGIGTVKKKGGTWSLTHTPPDRRVQVTLDIFQHRGTANLQFPVGTQVCSIQDRDTRNNSCQCS